MGITRRSFLKGVGVAGAGGALMGLAGCASEPMAETGTSDASTATQDPSATTEWTDTADAIIVGMGFAGLSAAATADYESLGTTIILEAAPEEFRGGNSYSSGQIVFCPTSVEAAITYQSALNGPYSVPDDVMQAWAEAICENVDWLTEVFGCDFEGHYYDEIGEFPDQPSADQCPAYLNEGKADNGDLWELMCEYVEDTDTKILYEARAIELIQDGNGNVVGVKCEDGRAFKANKGVLLACGGFEHNRDLMHEHCLPGFPDIKSMGSWYNRGDGILMAQKLGAQLWHMSNFSGANLGLDPVANDTDDVARCYAFFKTHGFIYVNERAQRFTNEEQLGKLLRHGKQYRSGAWVDYDMPTGAWAIFNQNEFDAGKIFGPASFAKITQCEGFVDDNQTALDAGVIVRCESVQEIADHTGLDADALAATLDYYNNTVVAENFDMLFRRGQAMNLYGELVSLPGHENDEVRSPAYDLEAIEAPYYVIALHPTIINTQGGPKRSAKCEILDIDDNPIPHLFAAGEMGCEYPYIYNVGGNVSEAISSGRQALRQIMALDTL